MVSFFNAGSAGDQSFTNVLRRIFSGACRSTLVVLIFIPSLAFASTPHLAFSDLVSGPDEGLDDGQGSGVIVTVWGQGLGSSQSDSKVYVMDKNGETRQAAHVYYWKNANGNLPSGPANLHASHKMQEVAFSIPDGAQGAASIYVSVDGEESNTLSFLVRDGEIYHVKSGGSDSDGSGSFSNPWRTVGKADGTALSGSTIYVYDVDTGNNQSRRGIYWNNAKASSTLANQFAIVAFPGYQPKVVAQQGITEFNANALVVSKLDVYSSNYLNVDEKGQPQGSAISYGATYGVRTSKDGRIIGLKIGDMKGGCASKYQGAINGSARNDDDSVSNSKLFGNEIYDYGCNGTDKMHHTTYLSVRSDSDVVVDPWEWGYNYLHGNKAKLGIHQYDENENCGDLSGPLRIHHNVVTDQAGAGISIGSNCGWSMDAYVENNVLLNVGLAAAWDGVDVNTSNGPENGGIAIRDSNPSGLTGTMYIANNLVYTPTSDGQRDGVGGRGCLNLNGNGDSVNIIWKNNVCVTDDDIPFVGHGFRAGNKLDNISGGSNVWYRKGFSTSNSDSPSWSKDSLLVNPEIVIDGSIIRFSKESAVVDKAGSVAIDRGIYGVGRGESNIDIGPAEYKIAEPRSPHLINVN